MAMSAYDRFFENRERLEIDEEDSGRGIDPVFSNSNPYVPGKGLLTDDEDDEEKKQEFSLRDTAGEFFGGVGRGVSEVAENIGQGVVDVAASAVRTLPGIERVPSLSDERITNAEEKFKRGVDKLTPFDPEDQNIQTASEIVSVLLPAASADRKLRTATQASTMVKNLQEGGRAAQTLSKFLPTAAGSLGGTGAYMAVSDTDRGLGREAAEGLAIDTGIQLVFGAGGRVIGKFRGAADDIVDSANTTTGTQRLLPERVELSGSGDLRTAVDIDPSQAVLSRTDPKTLKRYSTLDKQITKAQVEGTNKPPAELRRMMAERRKLLREIQNPGSIQSKAESVPSKAVESGKTAEVLTQKLSISDYKGSGIDNVSSFFKALSGSLEETGGGKFMADFYEKVLGGVADRDATQKFLAKNLNANLGLSNNAKRKVGESVHEALRRIPDDELLSVDTAELIARHGYDKQTIEAAKVVRAGLKDRLDMANAARLNRGQELIPERQQYAPQWTSSKDQMGAASPSNAPGESFNPFAQERTEGLTEAMRQMSNADIKNLSAAQLAKKYDVSEEVAQAAKGVELNVFKQMDAYNRYTADEIYLTPVIRHLNDVTANIRGAGNVEAANWLDDYVQTALTRTKNHPIDQGLGIKGGNWRQRVLQRLSMGRSLMRLVGNLSWSLGTQPLSLGVVQGKFGGRALLGGMKDYVFDKSVRDEVANLEIYRLKRGSTVGSTAGGQLDRTADSVLKTRREFFNDFMSVPANFLESTLDGIAAASARRAGLKYVKDGKMTQKGLRNYMNMGIEATQSVYAAEMRPAMLQSLFVRAGAPFQTYSFEMGRHVKNISRGHGSGFRLEKTQRLAQATNMVTGILLVDYLVSKANGKDMKTTPGSFVPLAGGLVDRGLDNLIGTEFSFDPSDQSISALDKDVKDMFSAVKRFVDDGDTRQLRKQLVNWGTGLGGIGGGTQINKIIDTAVAYNDGHLKYGKEEIEFDKSPSNVIQSMFKGPWSGEKPQEFFTEKEFFDAASNQDIYGFMDNDDLAAAVDQIYEETDYMPRTPSRTQRGKELSKDEYTAYNRLYLKNFQERLDRLVRAPSFPSASPEIKKSALQTVVRAAGDATRDAMFGPQVTQAREYDEADLIEAQAGL